MSAVNERDERPDCRVSLDTYIKYPREYTEYYREILEGIINPYRNLSEELGFSGEEFSIILSNWSRARAKITEFPANTHDSKKPYAIYYSSRGFIPGGEIQAGIHAGGILDILPPSVLAYSCMRVDNFLHKIGNLASWNVKSDFEKGGCKVQVEYPRLSS